MSSRDRLSRLLEAVTDIHHRQQVSDFHTANLAKSAPIAFRRFERLRVELERQVAGLESQLLSLTERFDTADFNELQSQLRLISEREYESSAKVASSETRIEEHARTLTYLLERIEFVRSELLFEFRYGASHGESAAVRPVEPRLISPLPDAPIRLNLGSGHIPKEGYVNVDNRDLPGVDLVADVENLPFQPGSVAEIFSSHFLEHFPEEQLRRRVLPYLFSLLSPGAEFRAVVPDAESMMRQYVEGTYPFSNLKSVIYGGQDYDGDFHFTMFTPDSIVDLLSELGLKDVRILALSRPNGLSFELEVCGVRESSRA